MTNLTAARPHTRRTPLTWGVFGELNRDWDTHIAEAPLPHAWGRAYPALADVTTFGELLESISTYSHPAGNDAVLHALLQLHADGHPAAGRAVMQSMLGKTHRLADTARKHGYDDPHQSAIAAMWTCIGTYPLRRTNSVAGNLSLDALRILTREAPQPRLPRAVTGWDPADHDAADPADLPAGGDTILEDPQQILRWALDHQVISTSDHQLLCRLYLSSENTPKTLRALAAELGISDATVRQRHCRAMRALLAAVRTQLIPAAAA